MGFSDLQKQSLSITATCSATLSMFGSLVIVISYARLPKANRKELGQRIVMLMSVLYFFASLAFAFGNVFAPNEGEEPSSMCKFQAWSIQIMVAAVVWNSVMAVNFYCLVVLKLEPRLLRLRLKYQFGINLFVFGILAFSLLGVDGLYGDATLWCWITSDYPGAQLGAYYTFVFLSWGICAYCLIAVDRYGNIDLHVSEKGKTSALSFRQRANIAARQSANAVAVRLRLYLIFFLLCNFFGLLNRIIGAVAAEHNTDTPFATSFLHILFVPLQGFIHMLIYHGFVDEAIIICYPRWLAMVDKVTHWCKKLDVAVFGEGASSRSPFFKHSESLSLISKRRSSRRRSTKAGQSPDWCTADAAGWYKNEFTNNATDEGGGPKKDVKKGVFVTTFNLGEAELQFDDLEAWLPRGFDVYAIGVQECMILPQLKSAILSHLNGVASFSRVISQELDQSEGSNKGTSNGNGYTMHCREIGSTKTNMGFHGMIAIMVCVREREVASGAVQVETSPVRSGVHMGVKIGGLRAPNKGGCGIALRYYDTNLAFLTSHFASDSGGNLRFDLRNQHTTMLLNGAVLESSDVGVDVCLAHHHTFVFGDFNYRTADFDEPQDVLELIYDACKEEIDGKLDGNQSRNTSWRQSSWKHLFNLGALFEACAYDEITSAWKESKVQNDEGEKPIDEDSQNALLQVFAPISSRFYSAWDKLLSYDELSRSMKQGGCFYQFSEANIRFPPTFRRERGNLLGNAGNYDDMNIISKSYTTRLVKENENGVEDVDELEDEVGSSHGTRASTSTWGRFSVSSVPNKITEENEKDIKLDTETAEVDIELAQTSSTLQDTNVNASPILESTSSSTLPPQMDLHKANKKKRPPSFTDRILLHSLSDLKNKIEFLSYNTTDNITVSDHRPVALACSLVVEDHTRQKGLIQSIESDASPSVSPTLSASTYHSHACYVLLSIKNPRYIKLQSSDAYLQKMKEKLYNTPYYNKRVSENKANKKKNVASKEKSQSATSSSTSSAEVPSQVNGVQDEQRAVTDVESNEVVLPVCETDLMDEIDSVELVFPIPIEDSLISERQIYNAAAEAIPTSSRMSQSATSKKNSNNQDLTFALPFDSVNENVMENERSFNNKQVINNVSKASIKDFNGDGIETITEVETRLGMHAILKFVDADGTLKVNGVINCADVIQKHLQNNPSLKYEENGEEMYSRVSAEDVEVELTFGGQPRGTVILSVTCERVERVETGSVV